MMQTWPGVMQSRSVRCKCRGTLQTRRDANPAGVVQTNPSLQPTHLCSPQTKDVTTAMNEGRFDDALKLRGR